jgi:hypothetical protein
MTEEWPAVVREDCLATLQALPGRFYVPVVRDRFALLGAPWHTMKEWLDDPDADDATALWTVSAAESLYDGLLLKQIGDEETGLIYFAVLASPDLDDTPWEYRDGDWSE